MPGRSTTRLHFLDHPPQTGDHWAFHHGRDSSLVPVCLAIAARGKLVPGELSHVLPAEMLAQAVQVGLVPECGAELFERLSGVVFAAVEATVDKRLDAAPQGLKRAAITRVEATMTSCESPPVRARKTYCKVTTEPKYTSASEIVSEP